MESNIEMRTDHVPGNDIPGMDSRFGGTYHEYLPGLAHCPKTRLDDLPPEFLKRPAEENGSATGLYRQLWEIGKELLFPSFQVVSLATNGTGETCVPRHGCFLQRG